MENLNALIEEHLIAALTNAVEADALTSKYTATLINKDLVAAVDRLSTIQQKLRIAIELNRQTKALEAAS